MESSLTLKGGKKQGDILFSLALGNIFRLWWKICTHGTMEVFFLGGNYPHTLNAANRRVTFIIWQEIGGKFSAISEKKSARNFG